MAELDSGGIGGGGSDDTSTGSEDEETERTRQSRDTSQLDPGDGGSSSTDSEMIGPEENPNRSVSSASTGESNGGDAVSEPSQTNSELESDATTTADRELEQANQDIETTSATSSAGSSGGSAPRGAATLASDQNAVDRALGSFDEDVTRAALTGIDVVFQNPGEIGYGGQDDIDISGPTLGGRPGDEGELDTSITESLTEGRGWLAEDTEDRLREEAAAKQQTFDDAAQDVEAAVSDVTGVEEAGKFSGGVVRTVGGIYAIPETGALGIDLATETASNLPETVREEGASDVALTGLEVGGRVVESQAASAERNPFGFAGQVAGDALLGGAAFKAVEKASDVSRISRLSTRDTVDLEDITSERGASGDLPRFKTDADADASRAVDEIKTRAQENPEVVTEKTGGESTLYHGTQSDFGSDIDVGEGASELPGLFTSPDASPIALSDTGTSLSVPSLKPRLPDTSGKSDRFVGLPGDDVDAIPAGRGGSGYELRDVDTGDQIEGGLGRGEAKAAAKNLDDVEVRPDQSTTGYDFLTEDAESGTAYVRPSGERTTELESIFPPDSQFERTGGVNVRVGRKQIPGTDVDVPFTGRSVPLDTFRRVDADDSRSSGLDSVDGDTDAPTGGVDADVVDYGDIRRDLFESSQRPDGSATAGGAVSGAGAGVATATTTDGGLDGSSRLTRPSGSAGSRGSGTGTGDGTTSDGPTSPPTQPRPPSSGPTSPPDSEPPTSTGPPSGGPTPTGPTSSGPPSTGPPTSPGSGGPTSGGPTGTDPTTAPPGDSLPDIALDSDDDKRRRNMDMEEFSKVFGSPVASPDEVLGEGESNTDGLSGLEDT